MRTLSPLSAALVALALMPVLASCKEEAKPKAASPAGSANSREFKPASTLPDLDMLLNLPPAGEGGASAQAQGMAGSLGDGGAGERAKGNGAEVPAAGGGEVVKLVEGGAEPRAAARYEFTIDKPQTTTATVKVNAEGGPMGAGGAQPPIRLTLKVTPKIKGADKTKFALEVAKAEILTGGAQVPPEAVKELKAAEAALASLTATFSATSRGTLSELQLGAKGAPPEVQELIIPMLEMLFAPLPEEPIGVGARWVADTSAPPPQDGAMKSTFTMTARTPTTADITVDTLRSAKPQAIQDPRAPAGATMQMEGKGKTKLTVRFSGVASKAEGESTTNVTFKDPSAKPARTAKSTVTVRHSLESK